MTDPKPRRGRTPGAKTANLDLREQLLAARGEKERQLGALRRLELRQKTGELVEVTAVRERWQGILATLRQRLLSIPQAAVPLVLAEADPARIQAILTELLYDALNDIADGGKVAS